VTAWPPPDLERLALSAEQLAERLTEPELRAQAFGLAAVIRQIGRETARDDERSEAATALSAAIAAEDEAGAVAALRRLAEIDLSAVLPVDWSRVTGG
jgi:hypothetical protein